MFWHAYDALEVYRAKVFALYQYDPVEAMKNFLFQPYGNVE